MKIYYWAPFLSKVATVKSVYNSFYALKNDGYDVKIINSTGEWSFIEKENTLSFIKFKNLFNIFPKYGLISSKIFNIIVFFLCFKKLYKVLAKNSGQQIVIAHLVTSLPIVIFYFFFKKSGNKKLILRISGLPKLNFLRKFFWKTFGEACHLITTPTNETRDILIKQKIFKAQKIKLLRDPIILKPVKNKKIEINKKKFLAVGRLTKQKNFIFLIKSFKKFLLKFPYISLSILGSGEQKLLLNKLIKKEKLERHVFLRGYVNNINDFYKSHDCLLVTSLWEDPGFLIIEAADHCLPIISSDCQSGPKEILKNGELGYLFLSNNFNDFEKKFEKFMNDKNNVIEEKVIKLNTQIKEFYVDSHIQILKNYLNLK